MANRYRCFANIIYPGDSAPDNWKDIISSFHVKVGVSPLHSPDPAPDFGEDEGVKFKPHHHLVYVFDSVKTLDQVRDLIKPLKGTQPFVLYSTSGYIRYLVHLDNPDKQQFDNPAGSILCFSGFEDSRDMAFDIGEYDVQKITSEINQFILDSGITEFADLYTEAMNRVKWRYVLDRFPCRSVHALLSSVRYSHR